MLERLRLARALSCSFSTVSRSFSAFSRAISSISGRFVGGFSLACRCRHRRIRSVLGLKSTSCVGTVMRPRSSFFSSDN